MRVRGFGRRERRDTVTGVKYVQDGEVVTGSNGRIKPKITYFICNKKGNFVDFCPDIKAGQHHAEVGEQHHMNTVTIAEKEESESNGKLVIITFQYLQINNKKSVTSGKLSKYSMLRDTCSVCSVVNCKKMIVNIQKSDKTLRSYKNGGHQDSNLEGELPDF